MMESTYWKMQIKVHALDSYIIKKQKEALIEVNKSPYDSNKETVEEVKNIKQKLEMGVF